MSDHEGFEKLEGEIYDHFQGFEQNETSGVTGQTVFKSLRKRQQKRICLLLSVSLIFLTSLLMLLAPSSKHGLEEQLETSIVWLQREQLSDGSWDAEKWGGKDRFKVGVSSLALISLIQWSMFENSPDKIMRGCEFLVSQQSENGLIGPQFLGDLYNHSLALVALKTARSFGVSKLDHAIQLAEGYLSNYKTSQGYYAYREGMNAEKNLTEWATLAMVGWDHYELNWQQGQSQSQTFLEKNQKNIDTDAMDLFFDKVGEEKPRANLDHLLALREEQGDLAGSWPIKGKWSHVGGRVFTTGMALLCFKPLTI